LLAIPADWGPAASDNRTEEVMKGSRDDTCSGASSLDPGSTASSLLEQVRVGASTAWQRFVHVYSPLVYGWARRAGLQAADAGDVMQEVFRAVLTGIGSFRRDHPGDRFRGWLWGITHNKLRDFWRRRSRQPVGAGGSDAQELLVKLAAEEKGSSDGHQPSAATLGLFRRAVQLLRSEFEERSWRAFWCVVVEGQRPAEVAAELGMTVNAVYVAKSRILHRLRREMGDLEP
jgi:RNA polymerase sigma-70 factor (ECF subfamily)